MITVDELYRKVAADWPFDEMNYPIIAYLTDEGCQAFAVKHVSLHVTKAAGRMAAACEAIDHNEALGFEKIRDLPKKLLTNALRLAELLGIPPEELV